jgi:myo-inositol catabolism protein IolC
MPEIMEVYRKIGDPEDRFDLVFWQRQGRVAIFRAALEMIRDAQIVRNGHADERRLQRSVERFGPIGLKPEGDPQQWD